MKLVAFLAFELFVDDLDLLIEHLAGEAVNRDVHSIVHFTFNDEACKTVGARRITPALRDQVDQ